MKHSVFLRIVMPVLLAVVLLTVPALVVLGRMGYFTPAPTAKVAMTAPADAPELVFVADYDFDPYSYLNGDGTPNGMDVEIAYELSNRLGMRPRIEFGTWSECKSKIKGGQADVLLGLEIFVDGAGTGTLKSIPVGSDTLSIIGRDAIDDAAALSGKRVGVSFGSALMGLFRLNCEYVEYFTYTEMFEAIDRGEIDYGICHASVASRLIEKNGYGLKPSLVLMESFPTMGIRDDEPELQAKINRTLEEMSADGTIGSLRDKWIVTYVQNRTVGDVLRNYEEFFILYAISAVILFAAYIVAVVTSGAAAERKKALEEAQEALEREIIRTRDEKAYQLAILNNAYSYSRINLSENRIIPPIIERENGRPVDYTDKFPQPLPSYEEVFAIGASRYVDEEYKESYVAYHNCAYLIGCYEKGELTPEYVCRIYSTILGWHYRKYITYLSKDETNGEIFGMSVAYDITKEYEANEKEKQYKLELEEARNAAEIASRYKTSFLFNMSHDIRTPMNAILGYTNIALNHIDEPEKVNDSLKKIRLSGGHLLQLINDILEMSRIEAGRLEIVNAPTDIYAVTEGVVAMSQALAATKDITFLTRIGELKNPYIYSDELHVNQIIINLISNAVKYTNPGGKVEYSIDQISEPEDGFAQYRVTVRDNGIGMSEEFQKHLFESFSREQTSTASKQEGAGLGLSIVKNVVDIIGGTIRVESKKGEGSVFTVELPIKVMEEEAVARFKAENEKPEETGNEAAFAGKKVLLVEDNEMNREIATDILEEAGLAVDTAEDGAAAVVKVTEKGAGHYDFILMDIQMPVMNGYEATAAIRKLPGGEAVPIIALSANAFAEDKAASLAAGMNDHVAKPINIRELFSVLAKCMH